MKSILELPHSEPRLSRQPGLALWRQIATQLQEDIAAGLHQPGGRLPTEQELSRMFEVNRHTVRRALEELSRGGLIRVEQGRGSFVAEDAIEYAVEPRTRFSEWIRRNGREPSGRVLRLGEVPAGPELAAAFEVAEGALVVTLERLGFADDRPVSLATHHFAPRLHGMLEALRRHATITEALAAVGVADYRRHSTRITARLPTAAEAGLLRTPRNRPLLVAENINVDVQGTVVEVGLARHPTPLVQMVFEP